MSQPWAEAGRSVQHQLLEQGSGTGMRQSEFSFRSAWHCWISPTQESARGTGAACRHLAQGSQEHGASSRLGLCPRVATPGSCRVQNGGRAEKRQTMTRRRAPRAPSSAAPHPEVGGGMARAWPACVAELDPRIPWEGGGWPKTGLLVSREVLAAEPRRTQG